jgi:hypothetical protein
MYCGDGALSMVVTGAQPDPCSSLDKVFLKAVEEDGSLLLFWVRDFCHSFWDTKTFLRRLIFQRLP